MVAMPRMKLAWQQSKNRKGSRAGLTNPLGCPFW
jgi:hypothetical protein